MSTDADLTGSDRRKELAVQQLRCEYETNPLGIEVQKPRLSWVLASTRRGVKQAAYQIRVMGGGTQPHGQDELWNSGKVSSDQSIHVPYDGRALRSGQRCTWQVRVWDEMDRPTDWSETAWWEMGLLDVNDWVAKWIGPDVDEDTEQSQPCPMLRAEFRVEGAVSSARARFSLISHCRGIADRSTAPEEPRSTPHWRVA